MDRAKRAILRAPFRWRNHNQRDPRTIVPAATWARHSLKLAEVSASIPVTVRLLILEPDEELLESFRGYFERATDFEVRLTANAKDCIEQLRSFVPQVLLMEPVLPPGVAQQILDAVSESCDVPYVPVLVLTKHSRHVAADHPSVKEFFVKPQSLSIISDTIRRLAAAPNH